MQTPWRLLITLAIDQCLDSARREEAIASILADDSDVRPPNRSVSHPLLQRNEEKEDDKKGGG